MYPGGGPAHPAIDRVRDQAVGGEEVSTAVHHANLPAARQLPCQRRFLNTGAKAAALVADRLMPASAGGGPTCW